MKFVLYEYNSFSLKPPSLGLVRRFGYDSQNKTDNLERTYPKPWGLQLLHRNYQKKKKNVGI